jgi:hypothetical protein
MSESSNQTVSFNLGRDLYDRVKAIGEREGIGISAALRLLVRDGIDALEAKFAPPAP